LFIALLGIFYSEKNIHRSRDDQLAVRKIFLCYLSAVGHTRIMLAKRQNIEKNASWHIDNEEESSRGSFLRKTKKPKIIACVTISQYCQAKYHHRFSRDPHNFVLDLIFWNVVLVSIRRDFLKLLLCDIICTKVLQLQVFQIVPVKPIKTYFSPSPTPLN
jgi:hypothetical protein